MHNDAMKQLTDDEERYKYFHRPEPRKVEGPVHVDEDTGMRYQTWDIGMVRNAVNRKEVKVFLDPIPHIIIDDAKPLQGWYKAKHEPAGVRPRPCMTDSILTEPYGGTCSVACPFCYINAGMRGYRAQGLTTVPKNYGDQVSKQLTRWRTSAAGYICSFIDPFLPLEKIYGNSKGCAEAFTKVGLPIYFLSRLEYPSWAYDILQKNKYSYAQMSINTSSEEQWKRLSPWAPPLEFHMNQIKELHRKKIYISVQCNPIIAGVTKNEEIHKLIWMLKENGADHVIFKFVETAYPYKNALIDQMVKRFGDRGTKFAELLTCNIGGQVTIDEEYRIDAIRGFRKQAKKAGITMALCYEYKYERDEEGKILNKTGVSMGRDFLTAEQCHGHRVPLFTRDSVEEKFREVEECPPSGCLHCADDAEDKKPACGSALFGAAGANRNTDYRTPIYGEDSTKLFRKTMRPDLIQIIGASPDGIKRFPRRAEE